jgi:hypothetical protein
MNPPVQVDADLLSFKDHVHVWRFIGSFMCVDSEFESPFACHRRHLWSYCIAKDTSPQRQPR